MRSRGLFRGPFLGIFLAVFVLMAVASAPSARAGQAQPVVVMVLWRGESDAEKAFKAELDRMGYDVTYEVYDAGLSRDALADILNTKLPARIKAGGVSMVYTQGTYAALEAKKALAGKTPMLFNIVRFPKRSGLVQNTETPGKNLSGVHDRVNPEDILAKAATLVPFKHVGLVYDVTASNTRQELLAIERYAEKTGVQVTSIGIQPDKGQLEAALKNIARPELGVDLVYLPPDDFLGSNASLVGSFLSGLKIPSVGAIDIYVKQGALFGLVPDFNELGRLAALSTDKFLRGTPMGNIAVAGPRTIVTMINAATAQRLGLTVPEALLKDAVVVGR